VSTEEKSYSWCEGVPLSCGTAGERCRPAPAACGCDEISFLFLNPLSHNKSDIIFRATEACSVPAGGAKLKVLCLHGYLQNAGILRQKMGSWRKRLNARLDFVFVSAPIVVTQSDDAEIAQRLSSSSLEHCSWYAHAHHSKLLNPPECLLHHVPSTPHGRFVRRDCASLSIKHDEAPSDEQRWEVIPARLGRKAGVFGEFWALFSTTTLISKLWHV
jgi:hypothetical protein